MQSDLKQKIETAVQHYRGLSKRYDECYALFHSAPDSPMWTSVWAMFQSYIELIDVDGWVEWYIYENHCGDKGMEAGFDDDMNPIRTIDDLVKLMEDKND